jgi:hypothetical protein
MNTATNSTSSLSSVSHAERRFVSITEAKGHINVQTQVRGRSESARESLRIQALGKERF